MPVAEQRFRSQFDLWRLLFSGALLVYFGLWILPGYTGGAQAGFLFLLLMVIGIFVWTCLTTVYIVGEATLMVRSGPWREVVPLSAIRKLRRTRLPVAGPALSIDRVQVLYEPSRSVLVSPADRDAFIRAIQERVPSVAIEGFAESR